MKLLFTIIYVGVMATILFLYSGAKEPEEYSEWVTVVVDGKRRTPQGSFYITSGGAEYVVSVSSEMTREFWHKVNIFEKIEAIIADNKWLVAIRFREEEMYSVEEFSEAGREKRSFLVDQIKYVSIIYIIILSFLTIKERR